MLEFQFILQKSKKFRTRPGYKDSFENMLFKNGKKAGYAQVYDDPEALIDAASKGKL